MRVHAWDGGVGRPHQFSPPPRDKSEPSLSKILGRRSPARVASSEPAVLQIREREFLFKYVCVTDGGGGGGKSGNSSPLPPPSQLVLCAFPGNFNEFPSRDALCTASSVRLFWKLYSQTAPALIIEFLSRHDRPDCLLIPFFSNIA